MNNEDYQKTLETLKRVVRINRRTDCEYYDRFKVDSIKAYDEYLTEFFVFVDLEDSQLEYTPEVPILHIRNTTESEKIYKVFESTFIIEIPLENFIGMGEREITEELHMYAKDMCYLTKYDIFKRETLKVIEKFNLDLDLPYKKVFMDPMGDPNYINLDKMYDRPILR